MSLAGGCRYWAVDQRNLPQFSLVLIHLERGSGTRGGARGRNIVALTLWREELLHLVVAL